nr:hypothetical protein [Tanacetum cinerariifolium]
MLLDKEITHVNVFCTWMLYRIARYSNCTLVIKGVVQPLAPTTAEQSLKIYEAEVKILSTASPTIQNIDFVSSQNTDNTNESVSAVASVSAASLKVPVSTLPNVDTLSDAVTPLFVKKTLCHNLGVISKHSYRNIKS